eukprot:2748496-Rhodomonas_salina.1
MRRASRRNRQPRRSVASKPTPPCLAYGGAQGPILCMAVEAGMPQPELRGCLAGASPASRQRPRDPSRDPCRRIGEERVEAPRVTESLSTAELDLLLRA